MKINLKKSNLVAGSALIFVALFYICFVSDFIDTFQFFFNLVLELATILLGVYVIMSEKWAIRLSAVFGLVMLINSIRIFGFPGILSSAILNLAYIFLIVNGGLNEYSKK